MGELPMADLLLSRKGARSHMRNSTRKARALGVGTRRRISSLALQNWEYKDDMLSRRAVGKFLFLGGKLKKRKPTKANSTTKPVTKARQSKTTAAAAKSTATAKTVKAKSAKL